MIDMAMALVIQSVAPPRADLTGTGPDRLAYHSIRADCGMLTHLHGRNGAWGTWSALLSEASVSVGEDADGRPAVVVRCREGWACILQQRGRRRINHTSHAIPFADVSSAQAYVARLDSVMPACGRENAQ